MAKNNVISIDTARIRCHSRKHPGFDKEVPDMLEDPYVDELNSILRAFPVGGFPTCDHDDTLIDAEIDRVREADEPSADYATFDRVYVR